MRGSVYKRCKHGNTGINGKPACRIKHGTWWWHADGELDEHGERTHAYGSGFPTKEDATQALNDHLTALAKGTLANDKGLTVADWLDQWIANCRKRVEEIGNLELKTLVGYETHLPELKTHLGDYRLRDLRHRHVDAMIDKLRTPTAEKAATPPRWQNLKCDEIKKGRKNAGQPCNNWAVHGGTKCHKHGGASERAPGPGRGGRTVETRQARTIDGYRRTLRAALTSAKNRDLVDRNVAEGTMESMPAIGRADAHWWQPEQVAVFIADLEADVAKTEPKSPEWIAAVMEDALMETAAFGGLRRGELGGQMWLKPDGEPAIDLSGHTGLTIGPTLTQLAGEHLCFVCRRKHRGRKLKPGPKSFASWRWVPLVEGTVEKIERHRIAQDLMRQKMGSAFQDHGLVFSQSDGTPLHPDDITDLFQARAERLGLPRIKLHEARHGACSLLLASGTPIETVSMILGHANPAITRAAYAHILKDPAGKGMKAAVALVRGTRHLKVV